VRLKIIRAPARPASKTDRHQRRPQPLGDREVLYRRTAEISPPGRSSRCGGVLIGRP
jgi:hypothetical protein